jgi:hypothetical protein
MVGSELRQRARWLEDELDYIIFSQANGMFCPLREAGVKGRAFINKRLVILSLQHLTREDADSEIEDLLEPGRPRAKLIRGSTSNEGREGRITNRILTRY